MDVRKKLAELIREISHDKKLYLRKENDNG